MHWFRHLVFCLFCLGWCSVADAQHDLARDSFPEMNDEDWRELALTITTARMTLANQSRVRAIAKRLPNIRPGMWPRLAEAASSLSLTTVKGDPERFAGTVFRLSGTMESAVAKLAVGDLKAAHVETANGRVEVISPFTPKRWKQLKSVKGLSVKCWGLLIGTGDVPVFIAPRFEWYPDRTDDPSLVNEGLVQLARAGLDVGLLDSIQNGSRQAFVNEEHQLFNDLASALVEMEEGPPAANPAPFDLLSCLRSPSSWTGSYVELTGTVRRISDVRIESKELREATGRSVCYHVDFFVPIGKTRIKLADREGQLLLAGSYGVTLVLFELPDAISRAEKNVRISVPGFFIKTWSHKTVSTRDVSSDLRRPNPIVLGIGSLAKVVELEDTARDGVDSLIGWFLSAVIGLIAFLAIWQWRSSGRRRRPPQLSSGSRNLDHLEDI